MITPGQSAVSETETTGRGKTFISIVIPVPPLAADIEVNAVAVAPLQIDWSEAIAPPENAA
jgi:hypothetical protein